MLGLLDFHRYTGNIVEPSIVIRALPFSSVFPQKGTLSRGLLRFGTKNVLKLLS